MQGTSPERHETLLLPIHHGAARTTQKTIYLDGLRGLAALLVYMQHHTIYFYGDEPGIDLGFGAPDKDGLANHHLASFPIIRLLYTGGSAAVSIFFVLSGYVLSKGPLRMISEGQHAKCSSSLRSAIIRRPFRLYLPLIAVSLIFAAWLQLPFGFAPKVNMPIKQVGMLAELTHCLRELVLYLNPFQQHGWFIAWFPYNGALWTIPIELKGSMLVFGVLLFLNTIGGARVERYRSYILWVSAYALLMFDQWSMSLFVFGLVLAIYDVERALHRGSNGRDKSQKYPRLQSICQHVQLLLGLYLLSQPVKGQDSTVSSNTPGWYYLTQVIPPSHLKDEYYRFYQCIGAVMLVHAILRIQWLQHLLATKPVLYLGRVSFSFYLIHLPMLWVYGDRAQRLIGVHGRNWNGPLWVDNKMAHVVPDVGPVGMSTRFIIAVWGILPVVLALSALSTRYLDEPSIRFSRWLSRKLGFDAAVSTGAKSIEMRRRSSTKLDPQIDRID